MTNRWTAMAVLAAAAVAALPRPALAQDAAVVEVVRSPVGVEEAVRNDLAQLAATLADPTATRPQRDEAARRLVDRGTPDARRLLGEALANFGNPRGQLAAAVALADDPSPDPKLQAPLLALLSPTADRELISAAATALTNYGSDPQVTARLVGFVMPDNAPVTSPALPESVRAAVLQALGAVVERPVAQRLVGILQNAAEPPAVRDAAADALARLTGRTGMGRDAARWGAWWADVQSLPEPAFRDRVLRDRSALADRLQRRRPELASELYAVSQQLYLTAPPDVRQTVLQSYLTSGQAELRSVGVWLVADDFSTGSQRPTTATRPLLRRLIGDSDADVRLRVAELMRSLNDQEALDPLITQLAQEDEPAVKAIIARTLGRLGDPRAVAALLPLLADPGDRVVEAATDALAALAPAIARTDARQAEATSDALQRVLAERAGRQGNERLRERVLAAVVALAPRVEPGRPLTNRQASLRQLLVRALNLREPADVRRIAVAGLGQLGDPRQGDLIVAQLRADPDEAVRVEAAKSLGQLPTFDFWQVLYDRMAPAAENSPAVRAAAWDALRATLPFGNASQLNNVANLFRDQPDKKLDVLRELASQYTKAGQLNDLAFVRRNMADILFERKEFAAAAARYRLALDYWRSNNGDPFVIEQLAELCVTALLSSTQYKEAATFASGLIAEDPANLPTVGGPIVRELARLKDGGDLTSARALIEAAEQMRPGLQSKYADDLQRLKRDVQQALAEKGQTLREDNAAGPRPVPDPAPVALAPGVALA